MAAHYALADQRVRAVGLLSPVTNLSLLSEFDGEPASGQPALRLLDLQASSATLALRDVWTIIGDQDTRVFTDSAGHFMRALQCSGCTTIGLWGCTGCPDAASSKHGFNELRIQRETLGHTVPPHADPGSTFAELARWFRARVL